MTVATYAAGDVIGFCLDCDAGKLYVSKNGTWQNSAVPASGTGAVVTNIPTNTPISPAVATGSLTSVFALNFGQQPFSYTPPTGFNRLNVYNLPDSTIKKGSTVMDATLYTGNLTGQSITNASAFKPDLVWIKSRSAATDNKLTDSVRGATIALISNSTAAETTDVTGMTAFNTNGFTLGASTTYNNTGATYVGWQWQAGQGSSSSNTSGSITSTVSVNATAGFSVVTYTGSGSNATVGHGLGVAPKFMIIKRRNGVTDWPCWHTSISPASNYAIDLDTTAAKYNTYPMWNGTSPTSSVFSIGVDPAVNASGGTGTYVAYCWAEIAGFSKFGSYTGNGSTDGTFVYTGFTPKFVLVKETGNANNWYLLDTARNPYNAMNLQLYPNASAAEGTGGSAGYLLDSLSNGFKFRGSGAEANRSGGSYIYMAFASNPFKNSNAF